MPPQGESTGLAIEDGILMAHIFSRREERPLEKMFSDFLTLRKAVIDKHYKDAVWALEFGFQETGGLKNIMIEWVTIAVLWFKRWGQENHFASDVTKFKLPE